MDAFHDELVAPGTPDLHERFFDRFVFNLHATDATAPSILFGLGVYPPKDTVDGFVVLVTESEQRNLRFSTELSATDGSSAGPFAWRVVEPMKTWHVALGPNTTGLEFDLTWRARTPAWFGDVVVPGNGSLSSSFEHLFQSGHYDGRLTIDGHEQAVTGWYGQRDRSRGVRTMSGGNGLSLKCDWRNSRFSSELVSLSRADCANTAAKKAVTRKRPISTGVMEAPVGCRHFAYHLAGGATSGERAE